MVVPILFLSHHSGNEFRAMDLALDSASLAASLDDLEVLRDFVVACGGVRDEIDDDARESALTQIFFGRGGRGEPCFSKCLSTRFFKA